MSPQIVGQRCVSEREPELGLGVVVSADRARIGVGFPATGEQRLYAFGTKVLKRVQFRPGETVATRTGQSILIDEVEEHDGLLIYAGGGQRVREDEISDVTSVSLPQERLLAAQVDPGRVFDLRYRALQAQARIRQSPVRGFLGGRIDLIPHQFYILQEVSSRQIPRVLLADEVGLGKTIEACLILQRLLAIGKVRRSLILVPESLVHQWFVELLRRFNLWFSIYDEDRCAALEQSEPAKNPFLDGQLALASLAWLAHNEPRREQVLGADWDLVIVDEAHHLKWTPDAPGPEYQLVDRLASKSPGLLLLTATPTQLGLPGHFARLRLLDPDRYNDYERFVAEAENFASVAGVAEKIVDNKPLSAEDRTTLSQLFTKDPTRLDEHMNALAAGKTGARSALLRVLLDQHGTGRVVFRNTRAGMTGFPPRKFCPIALQQENPTLHARIARELQSEEAGTDADIRYNFKEDPRIDWLADFLRENRAEKVLLICKSIRKVTAIEVALKERLNAKIGLFHEGLPLVQRDRNAAWFAEPEGAQLLLCSEIGSEGRNFQFAHHLVLFDLPLDPGLVEQRIGRLDRIGQKETIRIHVPYLVESSEEAVVDWYHRGLDAFETSLQGGNDYQEAFKERLLSLALSYGGGGKSRAGRAELDRFVAETAAFRQALQLKMNRGRDRLLELNSFDRDVAESVISRIRLADAETSLKAMLADVLDHFGVRVKDHEGGDFFLDPSHAYVESFPSIPRDGMLATYDRKRAIAREDIRFVSADHPLVHDALSLLIDSKAGTTAFGLLPSKTKNILLEIVFVLEAVAEPKWNVDRFFAAQPLRVLVDVRGQDLTDAHPPPRLAAELQDGNIHRFLELPGFNAALLKALIQGAEELARGKSAPLIAAAENEAKVSLTSEYQRLLDLQKLNDLVRPAEIALAQDQLERTCEAIRNARLRLDSLRLILEGPTSR